MCFGSFFSERWPSTLLEMFMRVEKGEEANWETKTGNGFRGKWCKTERNSHVVCNQEFSPSPAAPSAVCRPSLLRRWQTPPKPFESVPQHLQKPAACPEGSGTVGYPRFALSLALSAWEAPVSLACSPYPPAWLAMSMTMMIV